MLKRMLWLNSSTSTQHWQTFAVWKFRAVLKASASSHCSPNRSEPGRERSSASIPVRASNRHRGHGDIMGYALRTDRFRYVEWREWESREIVARELYDHETDPQETRNVVGSSGYARHVVELKQRLADGWESALPPEEDIRHQRSKRIDTWIAP